MKIGKKFWSAVIVIVLVLSLLPLTSASPQGPNSVRKSGKDYVLCVPGEYCIGRPITRAIIPSNASSNRTVLSFDQPELPTVSRITSEEARKYFERDKKIYGEPDYVSFPYGSLKNVTGFEINSRNIESKKHLLTNKTRIHGVLLTNGISIYDGSAYELLKSKGVKIYGPVGWSKDVTVPVEALDDIEKSGYFIWFGLVPKEGKASKKLIENATANPDKVFSVRIWVYDDVKEQESRPFLEPYIAGPIVPKMKWSDFSGNYYVNVTGQSLLKILEYDFVYMVVERPYEEMGPGNYHGMPAVGTDVVYAATTGGLTGSGINISFIDSGVKTSPKHQDLPTPIWQYDYCNNVGTAEDLTGHGTHVTGIALGRGTRDPRFRGVAPGANLMMAKMFGCTDKLELGIVDLIENGANIISNSWYFHSLPQSWDGAIYFDRYMYDGAPGPGGVTIHPFIVAITGNNGTTLGDPGHSKNALTVGASKIGNDGYGSYTFPGTLPTPCTDKNEPAGKVACFSNYGPTEDSNRVKPDVIAPGYNISSTALSGKYSKMWGTSFSAPYVAGIAALFMEQYPGLIDYPEVIKANIINSAIYLDGVPANKQGHGHVNALNAIYDQTGIFEASTSYGSINGKYNLSSDFTVPSGYKEVKVTLVYIDSEHGGGKTINNLDLEIYDQNNNLIGSSTSANDTVEEVKISGEPSGTWTRKIIGADVSELVYYAEVISVRLADPSLSLSAPGTAYTSPSSSFLVDTTLNNAGFTTVGSYIKLYLPSGFSINYANITRADGLVIPVIKKRLYYDSSTNSYRISLGETINGYPRKVTWNITAPSTTGTYTLNFKYGALNTAEQQKSVNVEVSTIPPGTIDTFEDENGATQSTNGGSWGDWIYYETSSSFDMNVSGSTSYGYSGAGGKFHIGSGTDPYSDYVEIKREWPGQPFDTDAGYISIYLKRYSGYSNVKLKLEDTNGDEVRTSWKSPTSTYSENIIDLTDFQAGQTSSFDWDNVRYITLRARQKPGYNTLNDIYFDELKYTPSVPSPPTGLVVTDYGYNYISLEWDDKNQNSETRPEGVYKYYIYRNGAPTPIGESTSPDYNDTGLSSGWNYCYKITAINGEGESDYSINEPCQTTKTPPDSDPPTVSYSPSTPLDGAVLNQNYAYIEISASETLNNANLEWNGVNESMSGSDTTWHKNKSAGDGTYSYKVWANDTAGNWGVGETRNVTFDATPPTVSFSPSTPPDGAVLSQNYAYIEISSSETLNNAYLEWNGANESMSGNDTTWYKNKSTGDGTYSYKVWANDTANNWGVSETRSVTLDTTPPTITILSPQNTIYKTNSTDLNYTVYDLNGIDWVGYSLDGTSNITLTGNTTLTNLSDGPHNITLYANDTPGNFRSKTVFFTIDTKDTEVYIAALLPQTSLKPGDTLSTLIYLDNEGEIDDILTISIKGPSGTEVYQEKKYIYIEDDEGRFIRFSWSVPSDAEEGKYRLMTRLDETDSISSLKIFTINLAPQITIDSPKNSTYNIPILDLNVSADGPIDTWWYNQNLGTNITFTPNTTITAEEGLNVITIYANDTQGNTGSSTVYFTIYTPHVIDILSPPNASITDTTPDLNMTVDEPSNITYSFDSEGSITGCQNCTSYITTYGEYANSSEQNLSLALHLNENTSTTVHDDSGNGNDGTITGPIWTPGKFSSGLDFSKDEYITIPHSDSLTFNDSFSISFWITFKEDDRGQWIISKLDGTPTLWAGFHVDRQSNNNLRFMVHNTTGAYSNLAYPVSNNTLYHVVLIRDKTASKLRLYLNGTSVKNTTSSITDLNVNTSEQLVIGAKYNFGNRLNATLDEVLIFNRVLGDTEISRLFNKTLSKGQHKVTVYANDTAANSNSSTVWFTVDTTPPTYSNLTPQNNSNTSDSGQDISIVITDEGSDVNAGSLSMTVAGNYYDTNSGKLSYDTNSGLLTYHAVEGEFTDGQVVDVTARARDNAGNLLEVIWSFIIDLILQITILSPPNETITDTTPDLNLTVGKPSNITYSWDREGNITGCQNCTTYNTTYGEATPDANTSLLLHFNENTGNTTYDDSSNQNDGAIRGGAIWSTAGRFGNALIFDGSDDFVEVPDNDTLDFNLSDSFTIETWVKTDFSGVNQYIVAKVDTTVTNWRGYHLTLTSNGKAWFMVHDGTKPDNSWPSNIKSTKAVNDGDWHHVIAVRDVASDVLRLYIDGVEDATPTTDGTTNPSVNEMLLRIGTYSKADRQWFNGTIDEIRILDRALNATEIAAAYNSSLVPGSHSVTVYAKDVSDNKSSTTRWFSVDTASP